MKKAQAVRLREVSNPPLRRLGSVIWNLYFAQTSEILIVQGFICQEGFSRKAGREGRKLAPCYFPFALFSLRFLTVWG